MADNHNNAAGDLRSILAAAGDKATAGTLLTSDLVVLLDAIADAPRDNALWNEKQTFLSLVSHVQRADLAAHRRTSTAALRMVVQYSLPRSGSTVLWQILNHLCGQRAIKTHSPLPVFDRVALTIRDFRDVLVSLLRVKQSGRHSGTGEPEAEAIAALLRDLRSQIAAMDTALHRTRQAGGEILIVHYDDIIDNLPDVIVRTAAFVNVPLSDTRLDAIHADVSLSTNKSRAAELKTFSQFDKASFIHGDHIHGEGRDSWRDVIPASLRPLVEAALCDHLARWGFPSSSTCVRFVDAVAAGRAPSTEAEDEVVAELGAEGARMLRRIVATHCPAPSTPTAPDC